LLLCTASSCHSQLSDKAPANRSFIVSPDISNQQINSFAEDALGHIWIGTARGANKYNAREFYQYFSSDDSLSISGNQVNHIFRDSKNRLWFCTTNGVNLYTDQDCFLRVGIETRSQNAIQVLEDKQGRILLNMVEQLCEYDEKHNKFRVVIPDFDSDAKWSNHCVINSKGDLWSISGSFIRCFDTETWKLKSKTDFGSFIHYLFLHDNGELWLASGITLAMFDTQTGKMVELPAVIRRHPVLLQTVTTCIHPYSHSSLLMSTHKGLFLYNSLSETVIHQSEDGFPFQAPDINITTMFTDSQKNLWIGSSDQGVITKYSYQERFNNNNYLASSFENKSVTSIVADKNENLWITTSLNGIFLYDAKNKKIRPMDVTPFFPEEKYFKNRIRSTFIDRENYIWLITETGRLIRCRYDGNRLHPVNNFFVPTSVSVMTQDKNGTIYAIGFNANIFILKEGDREFQSKPLYPMDTYVFTSGLITLSDGHLCVASFGQSMRIINPENWDTQKVDIQGYIKKTVCVPTVLYEDSQGDIWIGTYINGLFRYSRKTNTITHIQGTACADIAAVREDTQKNIWVSTLFGLSKYDRTQNKFIHYYRSDGIGGNQFNERSACRLEDGTLIFGGTHGLTFFNPVDVPFKRDISLLFEELKIHNQPVLPYQSRCIDKHLSYNPTIRLKHNENSFSISFTALDYCEYERVRYYYMLEGFDKIWIDAGNNREAYYSNLPAGNYTFKVKITDKDHSPVKVENTIPIRISPAPMQTGWAYCIYCLLGVWLIFFVVRLSLKMKKDQENALLIKREQEQEKMVNKMNMSFFANISHEFRTPLTMIAGPVMQLCEDKTITGDNKKLLYIVQRSVSRMLKLVNQLMDFNRLENDALKLKVKRTDIISELNRLIDIFRLNANNKQISLITYGLEDSFTMLLDIDKLDKIVGNLLSNALKYTQSGGKMTLSFDVIRREEVLTLFTLQETALYSQYVKLTVSDTGKGIPEDKLDKIFERYYQIDQDKGAYNWGTGIGLYYAKRLAELHHGYIKACNGEECGAVFMVLLPVDDNAYTSEEKDPGNEEQQYIFPIQTEAQYRGAPNEKKETEQHKILVVDDDTEIVHYLKTLLSPHYKVMACFNAGHALKQMKEEAPDLVLSDVIMPDVNGYDFCRMIKDDLQLCHIPVVLVTAKTTVENQVEGLNTGADAYVTKPFDPAYLLALIKSQLKNRENVRNLLRRETKTDTIEKNILSPQDNAFMTELYQLMEAELSNSELNITRMTEVLKVSRTKLYYKIKGLTGNNPNVFFKTYKLNRAAELLREGKLNISEIAYITGFSTLPHFSASFKKQFGVNPSEYN
jgi:signal transduction histidine kinase/ligand-binding sensor domain-containing protein/DNA-binding response OmpR family regulator